MTEQNSSPEIPSPQPLSAGQIQHWRDEHALLVPGLIDRQEISTVMPEFDAVYQQLPVAQMVQRKSADNRPEQGQFHIDQVQGIRPLPTLFSPKLNLLLLHEKVLSAVSQLLNTPDIYLYSSYMWSKLSGQTDFNQPFHRDYPTHTLLVPPKDPSKNTVNIFVYLTDVTVENGPLRYVPHNQTPFPLHRAQPQAEGQRTLGEREVEVICPAGSVLFYTTALYHRGTDLTGTDARRDVLGMSFRRADMPYLCPRMGDFHPMLPFWNDLVSMASVQQLSAIGFPSPGHEYWDDWTVTGVEARYPDWDSRPWRQAAGLPPKPANAAKLEWPALSEVIDADDAALLEAAEKAAPARQNQEPT